ncbi:hypothetical protein FOL47_002864, partial [Perkinsus chesapeaki]
ERSEGEVNSFKVAPDNLCGVKLRKFIGWLEELEECRSAGIYFKHIQGDLNSSSDVISRFTEQLDAQVVAKQEPAISPLAFALTVGSTSASDMMLEDFQSLPVPFRVVHLDLSESEVVRIGQLQREDTTPFHGVRVKDILVYADCLREKVTCPLAPLVQRQIQGWFGHSMWCLNHPAANCELGGSVPLLYVLSSAQVCTTSSTTTTQPRVVVLMVPPESDASDEEPSLRWKLMRQAHSTTHLGVGSTQNACIRLGWWVNCLSSVKAFVMQCWCQEKSNLPSNARSFGDIIQVQARFNTIAMDHKILPESIKAATNYVAVLGIIDMSSGYCIFEPVSSFEPSESYTVFFRRWLAFSIRLLLWVMHGAIAVSRDIQSASDLHHWLGLCEVMINMLYRQVLSGILSTAEREDGDSSDIVPSEQSESLWVNQLRSTCDELLPEYHVWRAESNLSAQRRQQA